MTDLKSLTLPEMTAFLQSLGQAGVHLAPPGGDGLR